VYKTSAKIVIHKRYTKLELPFTNYSHRGIQIQMQYMKCRSKRIKKGSMVQSCEVEKVAKHEVGFTAFKKY